jgi:hypothetical protein
MTLQESDMTSHPTPENDLHWDNRTLCIDGNCIGVIGPDGRCKECGKPFDGVLSEPVESENDPEFEAGETTEDNPSSQAGESEHDGTGGPDHGSDPDPLADEDWENRRLCSDGNCIGIIGPDGRCKECGRPGEAPPVD